MWTKVSSTLDQTQAKNIELKSEVAPDPAHTKGQDGSLIIAIMEITWLGHGSFQFRLPSGQVVLMDPWIEGNPAYPKGYQIERVDTICVSHGHFDHIHDAPPLAKRFSPEVVAIYETCHWLESKGVANTRPMNKGGSQKVGEVTVTMTHAVHSCGILDEGKIIYGGEAAGYVLRFDGRPRRSTSPATPTCSATCS